MGGTTPVEIKKNLVSYKLGYKIGVDLLKTTTENFKSVLCDIAIKLGSLFQNNLKDLDPSIKTDLDFRDFF